MANGGQDPATIFSNPDPTSIKNIAAHLPAAVTSIQTELTPLFAQFGAAPGNIITDIYAANGQGIDLLFDRVAIAVANGTVSITDVSSGASILPTTSITGGILSGSLNVSALGLYTITGSVKTSSGTALSGVKISLPGQSTVTDANGNYSITGLENGNYTLDASLAGYIFTPSSLAALVQNANISGLNFTGAISTPEPTLVSITVTPTNTSIAVGAAQQFTATGTYSDNSVKNLTSSVTWNSSSPSVATIATSGIATMVATGTTTITAASGAITGTSTLSTATGAVAIYW